MDVDGDGDEGFVHRNATNPTDNPFPRTTEYTILNLSSIGHPITQTESD